MAARAEPIAKVRAMVPFTLIPIRVAAPLSSETANTVSYTHLVTPVPITRMQMITIHIRLSFIVTLPCCVLVTTLSQKNRKVNMQMKGVIDCKRYVRNQLSSPSSIIRSSPSAAEVASWSQRSFWGWPACPFTQIKLT